jgi:hypothetical protein
MKKLILLIIVISLITSCKNNPIEDKTKKYMTDNIVSKFNDPSSYEYDGLSVDTFKVSNDIDNQIQLLADTLYTPKQDIAQEKTALDSLEKLNPDSVIDLEITVRYRGKNKLGAMVLDSLALKYNIASDRFTQL